MSFTRFKVFRILFRAALGFCGFLVLYLLAAILLPLVWLDPEPTSPHEQVYTIWVKSNGVHTDLVLPVKSPHRNWTRMIPPTWTKAADTSFAWLAIGWGDRGFYLETPTWADLRFSTAFKAATGLSQSACHATYYRNMRKSPACIPLNVSAGQYQKICRFIDQTLQAEKGIRKIETNAVYGTTDVFTEAAGSYSLFSTCNSWTNLALKKAGLPAVLWTPTDKGILHRLGQAYYW